jgi:RNA polymerase-binding transcription factor DksA
MSTQPQTQALADQRAEILAEIARLQLALESSEVDPSEDEADPDVVEREKILAVMAALDSRLSEVDAALRQTEAGAYGLCERCGEPIDPERLKIVPEATMCVRCKSIAERQRGSGSPPERFLPTDW